MAGTPHVMDALPDCRANMTVSKHIMGEGQTVLVDDGFEDRTWTMISHASTSQPVTDIKTANNHGRQPALLVGLIGEYLGKVYLERKRRHQYLVEKTVSAKEKK